jgi:hypothetical protein
MSGDGSPGQDSSKGGAEGPGSGSTRSRSANEYLKSQHDSETICGLVGGGGKSVEGSIESQ